MLQNEQKNIDVEIVNSLIECTPEWWNSAELTVERNVSGDSVKFRHHIASPEGYTELVEPTEELFFATRKLDLLFAEHGIKWLKTKYLVSLQEDDSWKFTAEFEYDNDG